MAILKSSIPYAKALYELGADKNILPELKADVTAILKCLRSSAELQDMISNPTISQLQKTDLFQKIWGGKIKDEIMGLIKLLITKSRIAELPSVCEAVIDMINKASNTYQVTLTTATQLSDDAQRQIASKALGNAKFEIESRVNPDIIGGFMLEYNQQIIDQSISTKIQTIQNYLDK